MIDERDLIRHLEEGGDTVWNRADPPELDLAAITGPVKAPSRLAALREALRPRPIRIASPVLAGGALACAALGIGVGALVMGGDDPAVTPPDRTPAVQLAMEPGDDGPAGARATVGLFFDPDGTKAEMTAQGLPEPEPGTYYEVWAINPQGEAVSLGRLPVEGGHEAHGEMPVPERLRNFRELSVSLEPAHGTPEPEGPEILHSVTAGTS